VIVAVGDRKRILPQLRKLKLGEIEVRDTEGQLQPEPAAPPRQRK